MLRDAERACGTVEEVRSTVVGVGGSGGEGIVGVDGWSGGVGIGWGWGIRRIVGRVWEGNG